MAKGNPHPTNGFDKRPDEAGRKRDRVGEIIRETEGLPDKIVNAIVPLLKSRSESIRLEAAKFLSDRGFGKVPQAMEHTGANGEKLVFDLEIK